MIESLEIRNLGLIDVAEIEFCSGLNVITGETGAGKSMVLNSVNLLSGRRGGADLVTSGASTCHVTANFMVSDTWVNAHHQELQERGAELEPGVEETEFSLLVSREVTSLGRSKTFLGGRQVPLGALGDFGDSLIAIHGQAEQQLLRDPDSQRELIDRAGGEKLRQALAMYQEARTSWRSLRKRRQNLMASRSENELKLQVLQLGIAEIESVDPLNGEDAEIEAQLQVMRNSSDLRDATAHANEALGGSDAHPGGVIGGLEQALRELERARAMDPLLEPFVARLKSGISETLDIDAEISQYGINLEVDPAVLEALEQRYAAIKNLCKKYGPGISEVREWERVARLECEELLTTPEEFEQLDLDIENAGRALTAAGETLSVLRGETAKVIGVGIESELRELAMPHAQIRIDVQSESDLSKWTKFGADVVTFQIAAHEGAVYRPIGKSASGGELSRLMLAIEVVLAGKAPIPTMIFDEVDAGIGGAVAVEVGRRLARLAEFTQVIVVTHLPQVAAFAQRHFVVEKEESNSRVAARVAEVTGDARTREIARMLSGLSDSVSGAAHADELLALAANR